MKPQILFRVLTLLVASGLVSLFTPALSAQSASSYVTSGLEKARQGDYDGAIADYTKALELNSSYIGAYVNRGMAKANQGNDSGAVADYTEAIKMKPGFTDAYLHRGHAEFLQGNFDNAIADYSKVIELKPDSQLAYFRRGLARDCQTNVGGASEDYAKALEMKSTSDDTASYLVLFNALLGRRLGKENDQRLKATSGWSSEWTKLLAMFLNDQISETDLMNRAGAAAGDDQSRQQGEAYYFSGVLHLIAGNKASARANFQKAFDSTGPTALVHRLSRTELDHP